MVKTIYLLQEYPLYESLTIVMLSEDYDKVKELFDNKVENSSKGYGYVIYKYELDKEYSFINCGESMDWIVIDYNGKIKNIGEM